ncbi:hypothetical protein LOD99_14207 [Oopsacas minuta]|uniref:Uncharacterized protein n=1 Tax=Oopsacas minuta TaxID=111878 RepID=A0AAV7KEU3_9METZ|nr:hypothetical protein LOD99_14207 [Oopsacas minuta]
MKAKCKETAKSSGEICQEFQLCYPQRAQSKNNYFCEARIVEVPRKRVQQNIPQSSFELESTLPSTPYGLFFKDFVIVGDNQDMSDNPKTKILVSLHPANLERGPKVSSGTLNEIIIDTDNELTRLNDGLLITRAKIKKCLIIDEHRRTCKEKLIEGSYSSLECITEISHTVGSLTEESTFDESSDEDEDEDGENTHPDTADNSTINLFVSCLRVRETTWIFILCIQAKSLQRW